jgi:hypothetical protein
MSENTFALIVTFATFAGMAAWPIFLNGCALWMQQHPLQRLLAEIESLQAEGLEADTGL